LLYKDLFFNVLIITRIKYNVKAKYSTKNNKIHDVVVFFATANHISAIKSSVMNLMLIAVKVCIAFSPGSFANPLKYTSRPIIDARAKEMVKLKRSSSLKSRFSFRSIRTPVQRSNRKMISRLERYFRFVFIT